MTGWEAVAYYAAAAVTAVSAYQSGQNQKEQMKASQFAAEYNAAVDKQNADLSRSVYAQREEQFRRQSRVLAGKRGAASAQSGLGEGGSNADLQNQDETLAELDALNIRYEGELSARGSTIASTLSAYDATNASRSARFANSSSYLNAAGSILSNASAYYGRQPQRTGGGGAV